MSLPTPHASLVEPVRRWFAATIDALEPARATRHALEAGPLPLRAPALLSLGKAATGMARGAVEWLGAHRQSPVGGVIVDATDGPSPHQALRRTMGDHPVPGRGSGHAADLLGATIGGLTTDIPVEVFLSGGTSSLVAAPVAGITADELRLAFEHFHRMGISIHAMNALRRRLTRWGGGRLAIALAPRPTRAWVISDVADNDLGVIGSGPLVTDTADPSTISRLLRSPELTRGLPASIAAALATPPTPFPWQVPHTIVADRHTASRAAARAIAADGGTVTEHRTPIAGEAEAAATALVERWWHRSRRAPGVALLGDRGGGASPPRLTVHLWSGEATVTLPTPHGAGGRAQQFALAAARELHRIGAERDGEELAAVILAAGTDGRDGPTDAAGAIVDQATWARLLALGLDPGSALARADAYPALDAVGALLRTGPTGTNVADLVMVASWQ
jgi:hydroxypyruvate reductase